MPRVSVVMPAYNAGQFIAEAIESVLAQTFGDFELIVVDDGAIDDTCNVVARFSDARVRYFYQENRERSAARNAGIRAARGEYVAFLDADDTWLPEKLARQVAHMDEHPEVGLVYCAAYKVRGGRVSSQMKARFRGNVVRPLLTVDNIIAGSASAVMVRRDVLDCVGGFDEGRIIFEDWDLWLRIAMHYTVDFVSEALACVRVHSGSTQARAELMKAGIQSFFDHVLTAPAFADEVRPVERRVRGLQDFLLGRVCCNAGEMGEARKHLWQSVRYDPLRSWAWAYLGAALLGRCPLSWLRTARSQAFRLQRRHRSARV